MLDKGRPGKLPLSGGEGSLCRHICIGLERGGDAVEEGGDGKPNRLTHVEKEAAEKGEGEEEGEGEDEDGDDGDGEGVVKHVASLYEHTEIRGVVNRVDRHDCMERDF